MKNSESTSNILELAKQGNSRAIAALINRQLQSKGITAIVTKDKYFDKEERLKIIFEYEQAKSKEKILLFMQKFFQKINPESICSVMVYGRKKGNDAADWRDEISLSNANKLVENINLSSEGIKDVEKESYGNNLKISEQSISKIDDPKEVINNNFKASVSVKRNNRLSSVDRYFIYFTLFLFFFTFGMLISSGRTLQVVISVFLAGYVIVSLAIKKGWSGSIWVSAAITYLLFPIGLIGFYFVWRNSFSGKRLHHFGAAFVAACLPYILNIFTVVNPASLSVDDNLLVPSEVKVENPELTSEDYPGQAESIEQGEREKYEELGKCQDELIARGASVTEIAEVCTPLMSEPEDIVPLTSNEVEAIACTGIVEDPSHPYYSDCIERGY